MDILLHRIRHRPDTIDGILKIDGLKVCDCTENAHHCLTPGNYQVVITKSPRHHRLMPFIVTNQSSLISYRESLIAPGNGVYALQDASILVGKHLISGIVTHTRPAFDTLYQRIRKNLERGSPVTLTIK